MKEGMRPFKRKLSKNAAQKFKNTKIEREEYYIQRKELFDNLREKWVHNTTKSFTEDLYEDGIQEAFQKHSKNNLKWLEKADAYAETSSDPLAALLSSIIENKPSESLATSLENLEGRVNETLKKTVVRYLNNKDECLKIVSRELNNISKLFSLTGIDINKGMNI